MKNETQALAPAKKEYQAPVLSEFGSVTKLTLDGGGGAVDAGGLSVG